MSRPSWVEVDLGAVAHNVRALAAFASGAQLCAVVKANGYGHGAPEVAKAALAAGAAWLAVATVEEGAQLRGEGITAPVLLLSEPPEDDLAAVVDQDLTPTLYRFSTIDALAREVGRRGIEEIEVHLKVDTGMHRVGVPPDAFPEMIQRVWASDGLRVGGVWSHLAVADTDPEFTRHQIETYLRAVRSAEGALSSGWPVSPSASGQHSRYPATSRIPFGHGAYRPWDLWPLSPSFRPPARRTAAGHENHLARLPCAPSSGGRPVPPTAGSVPCRPPRR